MADKETMMCYYCKMLWSTKTQGNYWPPTPRLFMSKGEAVGIYFINFNLDSLKICYGFIRVYRGFAPFSCLHWPVPLHMWCLLKERGWEQAKLHWLHLFHFLCCAFSNASSNWLPKKMQSRIGCICLIFLPCVFSNVSSNCLPEKIHSQWLLVTLVAFL